ncbi:MAG: zf-HC2 domain-containing protein [Anaerotignum sp.]
MKCEIIRDLLPMYMDGLTSEESNMEIETHLEDCALCSEILQQMQKEMETKEETEKRKINLFRKFNRRMRGAVATAVAVCICLSGAGWKAFAQGFAVEPDEITMDVRIAEDSLYLDFELQEDAVLQAAVMYDQATAEISLRKAWQVPFDDRGKFPNRFSWGMDLDILTVGAGEKVEVAMVDGSLERAETITAETPSTTIQNGDKGPVSVMMFREDNEATSITIGETGETVWEEYTVNIDYGNQTESYTLTELLEMAQEKE